MTHILMASFFMLTFLGAGIGLQRLLAEYWQQISSAFAGNLAAKPAREFRVKVRRLDIAPAPQLRAAAA
jgi:hypothetical protein